MFIYYAGCTNGRGDMRCRDHAADLRGTGGTRLPTLALHSRRVRVAAVPHS